ncbi:MAG: 5-formyltetrahydrofolate cyclo-ligase [Verrucomicrobiota bacterium]
MTPAEIQESKRLLRQQVRARLQSIDPARRVTESAGACARLRGEGIWAGARSVLFYAPVPGEIDVWPLVEAGLGEGKKVALPRFEVSIQQYIACRVRDLASDIIAGRYGIREPAEHCEILEPGAIDLVLVPGVGFDLGGRRLGRGRGFYDRLLAQVRGVTCGVGFEEQLLEAVPVEEHDAGVGWVVTPRRMVRCGGGGRDERDE